MSETNGNPFPDRFASPIDDRYFEDYVPGDVHEFGAALVTEEAIVDFGRRYDPQDFHTDRQKAAESRFGGLIASGWQTCALMMRMFADHFLSKNASLSSPVLDELRWLVPVRPGDILHARVPGLEARRSVSKPDRGIVRTRIEVLDQRGTVVLSMIAMNLIGCRALPAG